MPAKRGERKETNDKKTLLISLLIGNALGAAIFFILLSIASAVMLKKGVSSGAYTPVSIVCAAIAAFIAGLFSVIPIRKNGLLLGLCSSVLLIACVVVSRRGRRRQCRHKNSDWRQLLQPYVPVSEVYLPQI